MRRGFAGLVVHSSAASFGVGWNSVTLEDALRAHLRAHGVEVPDPRGLQLAMTHVAALRTVLNGDLKGHGGASGAALLARLRDLTQRAV